jgi:multiple sugar transport system substrate-binding protein
VDLYSKKLVESGLSGNTECDTVVIKFWQYWAGEEKEALSKLIQKFNKEKHGFTVEMQSISLPRKKVMMAIAANVPPDLVLLDGDMVMDFALRNALLPLEKILVEDGTIAKSANLRLRNQGETNLAEFYKNITKIILPNYLEMLFIKGSQVALPIMPAVEALHINKTLLNKYNLESPESLEDLIYISDSIIKKSNFNEFGWLPTWPIWSGRFIVTAFTGKWAERSTSPNNKEETAAQGAVSRLRKTYDYRITANAPENIKAWEWALENFIKKIPQEKLQGFIEGNIAYQSPDNPFYAGQVALETSGVWEYGFAKKFSPNYQIEVKAFPSFNSQGINLQSTAPRLKRVNNHEAPTEIAVDALAIPKGAKNSDKALYFMLWLLKKENINYLALSQNKFPPLKLSESAKREFIKKHQNPYIEIFMDLAESSNAVYFPHLSFSKEYKREIKKAFDKVLRLEMSPKEALDDLQRRMLAVQRRSVY